MADKKLCVGVIAGPHGVRGEVRVKSFTADPDALVGYGPFTDKAGQNEYAIEMTGRSKDMIRGRIRGIDDRDAAAALRGTKLYIDRDILPAANEGEFYYADLIGLPVFLTDGTPYGSVKAVQEFGAGDLIETQLSDGTVSLLPFTREIFPIVDLSVGHLIISPPEDTYATVKNMDDETEEEPS
ncbi:MAG: 16S rRNA processing protein RimM [Rhodospirillaceae bacterium]|nr:16S rRNA processing protein RimM [Rhodospirillaceae bacterium]|tara:strand:- start:312 stop:860 length:549 start_codon:yes stop_codon:yes gene_type:complete